LPEKIVNILYSEEVGYQYPIDNISRRYAEDTDKIRNDSDSDSDSDINTLSRGAVQRFETAREHWNEAGLPKYPYTLANTRPEDTRELIPTLDAHTDEEIQEAIENYRKIRDTEGYELDPVYQSFPGFLKAGKGVDKYIAGADPFLRCKINGKARASPLDDKREKMRRVYEIAKKAREES
jgi:surfactin synthase thioesterase subunit